MKQFDRGKDTLNDGTLDKVNDASILDRIPKYGERLDANFIHQIEMTIIDLLSAENGESTFPDLAGWVLMLGVKKA